MCGIAGVVGLGTELDEGDAADVERMTTLLVHRGPDGTGYAHAPRWRVGNTRLAILDLSRAADLPMQSEDGNVVIAYNGEVTNFRELRARFRLDERYRFRTESDTEVLLHLYEELGIDFVEHLSGMFAFFLVDRCKQRAWLVRDFYGIRPLFFLRMRGRLYFASELKAFFGVASFEPRLCEEAVWHFLGLAYIPGRLTPYVGVEELPAAHLLEIDLARGEVNEEAYYRIEFEPHDVYDEDKLAEELHDAMRDSVRRNLISDAPIGMTLSGGFDTSSILALARELGDTRELHTFSVVMDEPSFNEKRYQDAMVEWAQTQHHEIVVRPREVLDHLVEHMAFLDEPSGDGAAVPFYLLAREAKGYVKVLLSGEGGDETFNAYETHVAMKARALYRRWVPASVRRLLRQAAREMPCNYEKLSLDFVAKRFTEGAELPVPEAHHHWRHVLSEVDKAALMPSAAAFAPTHTFFTEMFEARADLEDDLDRISVIDFAYYFVGDLMVKNDRMMMAHSIEARFPYADRLLHEFVATIPAERRIRGLSRRYMQKRAMEGRMPPLVHQRTNMGLEMPHSLWFLSGLRELVDRWLTRERIERTGCLRYEAVRGLWDDHVARRRDNGRALWCILNFVIWFELFIAEGDFRRWLSPARGS